MALGMKDMEVKGGRKMRATDIDTERAITALMFRAAKLADERKFLEWMDTFTADCTYSAITHENKAYQGLHLFKDVGRPALHVRVAFLMGLWQVPRGKTLHLVTNIQIWMAEDGKSAKATSNFIMTRTSDMEHSNLHACGVYDDEFEQVDGVWFFKSRAVTVDTNLLPAMFTELL
jgi:3-phenylpropionate/cinnamic acid dioxygenase small subunit